MRRLGLIALFGLVGCITPSIPIPPPDPSMMDFQISTIGTDGSTAVLTYPADLNYAGGYVYVLDHETNMGVFQGVNADDSIGPTAPLAAKAGDQIIVTVDATAQTVSTCVVLRQGTQDPNTHCEL